MSDMVIEINLFPARVPELRECFPVVEKKHEDVMWAFVDFVESNIKEVELPNGLRLIGSIRGCANFADEEKIITSSVRKIAKDGQYFKITTVSGSTYYLKKSNFKNPSA